jgi:hypothetical protein
MVKIDGNQVDLHLARKKIRRAGFDSGIDVENEFET